MTALAPDVVLRADRGLGLSEVRGAEAVAGQALMFAQLGGPDSRSRAVLVNGDIGQVSYRDGKPFSVLGFTVIDGRIAAIGVLADPARLARLTLGPTPS